jgi:hypothetical protein
MPAGPAAGDSTTFQRDVPLLGNFRALLHRRDRCALDADWQNDALTWPELASLFRRRDLPRVEGHLRWLKAHDVTCFRLMLEYCYRKHHYLERPAASSRPWSGSGTT